MRYAEFQSIVLSVYAQMAIAVNQLKVAPDLNAQLTPIVKLIRDVRAVLAEIHACKLELVE